MRYLYILFVKTDKTRKWSIQFHFAIVLQRKESRIMSERAWVVGVKTLLYFRPGGLGKLL